VLAFGALAAGGSGTLAAVEATAAPRREDFAWAMPVVTDDAAASPAWRVALPLDVYRALVRADRGDLRVFNARGEAVPYQVRRPTVPATPSAAARPLPTFALAGDPAKALRDVRVRIDSAGAAVSVQAPLVAPSGAAAVAAAYIVDARGLKSPIEAFELRWNPSDAQFAGRLDVEASDDLGEWRRVGSGSVANLSTGSLRLVENRIDVPATEARFWRLAWAGRPAPFAIGSVGAVPAQRRPEVLRSIATATGVAVPTRPGEYEFDLGAALPADRVNVRLPEANMVAQVALRARRTSADDWQPVAPALPLYRLTTAGGEIRNAPRSIDPEPRRFWTLQALPAGSGLGNGAPALELQWPPHEVWFVARGPAPFLLAYGSATATGAETALDAILEAASLGADAARVMPAVARLGPQRELGGRSRLVPPAPPFPWRAAVLWAVLLAGVVALGAMAWRLLRETRGADGPRDPGAAG
jgi:hypothetical protein